MNLIEQLIHETKASDITLYIKDGRLAFIAEQGRFPQQLKEKISQHKEQILAHLLSMEASASTGTAPFSLLSDDERTQYNDRYDDAYPMSALQVGMVFHTQLEQFNGIYHDIMTERVKCPWDQSCFEQALATCIQEHPILRTGFRLDGERPLQHVHKTIALPLVVEDLRDQPQADQDRYVAAWIETRKRHVFDWEHGPLFHIHIFRRSEDSFEFAISFHHAVLDGWSRAALTTVLYNRYEQLLSGQALDAATPDHTYRDFIALEQQVLADPEAKAHFANLLDDLPVAQLPRRTTANVTAAARDHLPMDAITPLSGRLIALARELGVPVQAVLLAGHIKVLALLSGQLRVLSCVTHNGRPEQDGAERGLGLFLNSLPMSFSLTPGRWRDLIEQVAQASRTSMRYRRYPLAKIQQDLGTVLGEVTFNYTHFHVYNDLTSSTERPLELLGSSGFEQTNFDFHIDVMRGVGQDVCWMRLIYNPAAFDKALMERVITYYVRAYEGMLEHLDAEHHTDPLLGEDERERLGVQWNATQRDYPQDQSIHAQFEAQVARTPAAIAVQCEGQTLTYAQLNDKADRLARYLVDAGVTREARVGIHLSRSLELMIAVLGVLKAGGAYVPLEPGLPKDRLSYMVQDAGIGWVLLESSALEGLPLQGVDVVMMDGAADEAHWLGAYAQGVLPTVAATDLAYVMYTSGSTGRPKGVMVEHRGLSNYLAHAVETYLPGMAGSVVSSPLCFDATLTTLLPPLLAGKPVRLLPDDEQILTQLAKCLFAPGEAWLFKITPAHLEALSYLEHEVATGTAAHRIVIGGEQLTTATLRRWKGGLLPQAEFINEYGPTETVVGCSVWTLSDAAQLASLDGVAAPIGHAIGNTQLYVLGPGQQLQPTGSVGELYIGGAGVARGYLNQDALTQERFIANPFGAGRLYKTGDLVRYIGEGELSFIGRIDDQVKIRGFRIELGEIEGQLRHLADVRDAVVLAREDEPGRKQLVAYVVPEDYPADEVVRAACVSRYREDLSNLLPDYMVPAVFIVLEALPLTPNGKVDKRALPAPDGHEGEAAQYVAPRNAVEEALCAVWADVLKRERVGVQDNFFSLGGDSILSIRIVSLLKQRGLTIEIKDLFQHQTVAQLAIHAHYDQAVSGVEMDAKQVAKMLIHERDELNEDDIEAII